ncbi:hemerythrin domain-containing protein [Cryptosporangium phraense]|uniref:Hemerythrin domain-containing protein n=1 Tax=Cryptosporangium phraense TaxID=2593070 RepID=A0A545ASV7_9ACTN|nr:hemerythrin domain-containing protein [Cryptosporangium phraense]TQS44426.1 hemerythrin domain-containing protein [Cryptosporangium phraense]
MRVLSGEVASATGPARAAAFADLRRLITVHETAEQLVLHPRMRGLSDGVDALVAQEHHGTELLAELERLDPSSADFDARFTRLAVEIVAHADHEELEEFPLVRERLPLEERQRMGHALRVAEDSAHPEPAHRVVDRIREALAGLFSSH